MGSAAARLPLVPIVHMPLAEEVGLSTEIARELEAREREALRHASCVIATGRSTVGTLEKYGVPPQAIVLALPGTDPAPLATPSSAGRLQLLCVATLNPGKGHRMLLEALAATPARDWHLTCAGSLDRSPDTVADVSTLVEQLDLGDHVTLAGELSHADLDDLYQRADLFLLATYRETFGMAVAEALARGIPVVSTDTGAIAELAGDAAGLIVPPGDAAAFRAAVARAVGDAALRARLAGGAREARRHLPSWDDTLDKIETALNGIER
jgi:glycosyltransferase involved in cell wall biosynthesis